MYKRLILVIILLLCLNILPTAAQDAGTCPAIVQDAINIVGQVCTGTGRNQVCYGNVTLDAEPQPEVTNLVFETTGDIANVEEILSLSLSGMNEDLSEWGVALMQLQANLPGTLPGQNVTVLLFGDVQIENQQTTTLSASTTNNVNVRSGPGTNAAVKTSFTRGVALQLIGRNEAADWVYVMAEAGEDGWLFAEFLNVEGDIGTLAVVPDTYTSAMYHGPMQAFYLKSGFGDSSCTEMPDSGILIQTPEGARNVELVVNQVNINLGSTVYVQAQPGDLMTIHTIEGYVTVAAEGVEQIVPPGTLTRVPVDENGIASGPPEYPQPYDYDALLALPLATLMPEAVELTPAVDPEAVEDAITAIEFTSLLPRPGLWSITMVPDKCEDIGPVFFGVGLLRVNESTGAISVSGLEEEGYIDPVARGVYPTFVEVNGAPRETFIVVESPTRMTMLMVPPGTSSYIPDCSISLILSRMGR